VGCDFALDAERKVHAVRILQMRVEDRENLRTAARLKLRGDDLAEVVHIHRPANAEGLGILLAESGTEGHQFRTDSLPHPAYDLFAEQNPKAAADDVFALAIRIVAEAKPRAEIHPAVALVGIIRIAERPDVELGIAQAIGIVKSSVLAISSVRHHIGEVVVAQAEVEDEIGRDAPVVLRENAKRVQTAAERRWAEGNIHLADDIIEQVVLAGVAKLRPGVFDAHTAVVQVFAAELEGVLAEVLRDILAEAPGWPFHQP